VYPSFEEAHFWPDAGTRSKVHTAVMQKLNTKRKKRHIPSNHFRKAQKHKPSSEHSYPVSSTWACCQTESKKKKKKTSEENERVFLSF